MMMIFVKAITGHDEYRIKYPHLELVIDLSFSMTVKQKVICKENLWHDNVRSITGR